MSRKFLLALGYTALFAPLGTATILFALHLLDIINAWVFPFYYFTICCIASGLSLIAIAPLRSRNQHQTKSGRRMPRRRRLLGIGLVILFLNVNILTFLMSYYFTHLTTSEQPRLGRPKPISTVTPSERGLSYREYNIPVDNSHWLEVWEIPAQTSTTKGTILLFHGNLGTKKQILGAAQSFSTLGFNTILVDFQGVGGSSGNTTTVGMREARDVVTAFSYIKKRLEGNSGENAPVILYGFSMGSAAILRAISVYGIEPDGIILDLPFVTLSRAIKNRLRYRKMLATPLTELLIFWASIQHGLNGFSHNPVIFAKDVNCPTLVIHGKKDKWVSVDEIEVLVQNISAPKILVKAPKMGHQQLVNANRQLWDSSLQEFLSIL
ncbi:MAG: alpha/beta hydrolase [Cyanobacteria bacterium P01_H01_bin.15]